MIPAFLIPALPALRAVGRFLLVGITIPLWLILAVALWLYVDRGSAVRDAVDRAVTELVAGAEIEAARATAEANDKLRMYAAGQAAEARRRAEAAEGANAAFAQRAAEAERVNQNLQDEIDERLSQPLNGACVVDDDLRRRLRN